MLQESIFQIHSDFAVVMTNHAQENILLEAELGAKWPHLLRQFEGLLCQF